MSGAATIVRVLALLPNREDQVSLDEIFRHSHWDLHFAAGLGPARVIIEQLEPGVVISDRRLPDACWQDVLGELHQRDLAPPLIVSSRLADEEMWGEVLHCGGYDLLAMPFQAQEVVRSVSLAWRHWREKFRTDAQPPATVPARVKVAEAASGLSLVY